MRLHRIRLKICYLVQLFLNLFRRYPVDPHITRYEIIELDSAEIAARISTGKPFDISIGGETLSIALTLTEVLTDDCELVRVTDDGISREPIQSAITYAGKIADSDDPGAVRLTVTPDVITGSIDRGDQTWVIEPLDNYVANASSTLYLIYLISDVLFAGTCGTDDGVDEQQSTGQDAPDSPGTDVSDDIGHISLRLHEPEILNIAMVADREFMGGASFENRLSWMQIQQSLIDQVNAIFETQLGISLRIKGHFQFDTVDRPFTSSNSFVILDELKSNWTATFDDLNLLARRRAMRIDLAHLTTGKNLDGSTIGRAFRPGVYGVSEVLRTIRGFAEPFSCVRSNALLLAHEIGHNLNAVHAEADEFCVTHFIGCLDFERTIMFPTLECDTRSRFSDGANDPTHNNNRRIRTNVHTGRDVDFS